MLTICLFLLAFPLSAFTETRVINQSLPHNYKWVCASLENEVRQFGGLHNLKHIEIVLNYQGKKLLEAKIKVRKKDFVEFSTINVLMSPNQSINTLTKPIFFEIAKLTGVLESRLFQDTNIEIDSLYPINDELLDHPSRQNEYYQAAESHISGAQGSLEKYNIAIFERYISIQNVQALIFYLEGLKRIGKLDEYYNSISMVQNDSLTKLKLAYCGILMGKKKDYILDQFIMAIEYDTSNKIGMRALRDFERFK